MDQTNLKVREITKENFESLLKHVTYLGLPLCDYGESRRIRLRVPLVHCQKVNV